MVSSGVDIPSSAMAEYEVAAAEKEAANYNKMMDEEAKGSPNYPDSVEIKTSYDSTHRQLRPRHIQLIGIGGTIGTALYVQIGHGLLNGGPASLFMAFTIWYVDPGWRCSGGLRRTETIFPSPKTNHFQLIWSHANVIGVPLSWQLRMLVPMRLSPPRPNYLDTNTV
jgi:amino acid transporter